MLWISSTWVKQLDVATVSICGAISMFLPGINLLNWRDVEKKKDVAAALANRYKK